MPRQCKISKKETVCDLQLTTNASDTADSKQDYYLTATQPWPFNDENNKEKVYTINGKKMVKTFYVNGNFRCQLTEKTEEMIEIGTTLNLHQFRTLLDVYSNLLSTLSAAFYKGEKTFIIHDLTDGIYASAVSGYLCLDVREFYINKMTGNPMPTRRGVSYNINEVITLQDILKAIDILNK